MNELRKDYQLIAFDIDGTLVNSKKELSTLTKQILYEMIRKKKIISIATGRPLIGTNWLLDKIEDDIPVITCNGAYIVMSKSKKVLYEKNLSTDAVKKMIEILSAKKTTFAIWSYNTLYFNRIDEYSEKYQKINKIEPIILRNYECILNMEVTKILWFGTPEEVNDYNNRVLPPYRSLVNCFTSNPYFIEIVDTDVSKAKGIKIIEQYFNIDHTKTMAFGDADNDVEMLEYVNTGVAMANASNACLKAADFVTKSNEQDGIFYAIQQLVK